MPNNYICALDIGSDKVAAAAAAVSKGGIKRLFLESLPSRGVRQGTVVDSIELVSVLSRLFKKLKNSSGINIRSVFAGLSGSDIACRHSQAVIPLAPRGSKVVQPSDIMKVIEQARVLGSNLEEEVIHQVPQSYSIDSQSRIANPLGLYSHRLEVDLYLVSARLSSLQSIRRAVNQSGLELCGVFFSGAGTALAAFGTGRKERMDIICDIGKGTTEIVFTSGGILRDIRRLDFGGEAISAALCDALNISPELAEDLKRSSLSVGDYPGITEDKEVLIKKDGLYRPIKQRLACEIATEKAQALCGQLRQTLEKAPLFAQAEDITVCGRTVLLSGFLEILESCLGVPVRLAKLSHPQLEPFVKSDQALAGNRYLGYLTVLGLACQAMHDEEPQLLPFRRSAVAGNLLARAAERIKEVYQEYF